MSPEPSTTSLPAAGSDARAAVDVAGADSAATAAPSTVGSGSRGPRTVSPDTAERARRPPRSSGVAAGPAPAPRWHAVAAGPERASRWSAMAAAGPERASRWSAMAVAGPAALAAALTLPALTSRSLSMDEAATATIIAQHGSALRAAIAHDGGNMAGYYALMHAWRGIAGVSPLTLRLPSAMAGVITVGLVAALAHTLYGRRTGVLAGVLMAISLPLVFWSQSARGYAPMLMLVTGSFLALTGLLSRAQAGRGPNRDAARRARLRAPRGAQPGPVPWAAAYASLAAGAIYMGLTAALAVPVAVALLIRLRGRRSVALAVAILTAIGAACVPLVVLAHSRGTGQIAWVSTITPRSLLQALDALTSAGLPPNFRTSAATTVALVGTSAALVVVIAVVGARLWSARHPGAWRLALPLAWLVVPVVLVLAESVVGRPMLVSRNLLVALPAASLLLGWGLAQVRGRWALAATVLLVAARAPGLAGAVGTSPENWRAATATVLARAQPGDCVAFYPADGRMAFRAYLDSGHGRHRLPRSVLPAVGWSVTTPFVEDYTTLAPRAIAAIADRCPRLWLVSAHTGQADRSATGRANYRRFLTLRARLAGAYIAAAPERFGYAPAVSVQLFRRPGGGAAHQR